MKKIYFVLLLNFIIVFSVSCKKTDEESFFTKGKKVKSGLIWEKSEVFVDGLLKGKNRELIFEDKFERDEFGSKYEKQGGNWEIKDGIVHSTAAKNRNLVAVGMPLPKNGIVELDLRSESEFVDIKFNVWGDGKIHDHGDGYTVIMGGWKNRVSIISKLHEHESDRVENRNVRWQKGKTYRVKFIKLEKKLYFFIDDKIFLAKYDKEPLQPSKGYKYFSFANWKSDVYFDNLKIYKISD